MDYSKFTSKVSEKRTENLIRTMAAIFFENPGIIPLAGGLPNTGTFPFKEIKVTFKDGTQHQFVGSELGTALQYTSSKGYDPLIKIWREYQQRWHSPPRDDWDVVTTTGGQDAASKLFDLFIDEGDAIMVQIPTYTGTLGAIHAFSPEFYGITQDTDGVIPEKIEEICEARKKAGLPQPKLLFINPTGSNPTGTVLTEERRVKIYALAQKYDFLIIEDDPYYFVSFLEKRSTSLLSLDTDGRVIRLDSFSKILSSGMRVGVLTAHKDIVRKIVTHIDSSTLHAPTLSQVLIHKLLVLWGPEKFENHLNDVRDFYRAKRDVMTALVEKHLTGLAEWFPAHGGMFIWVKITVIDDVYDLVLNEFVANGVLVVPGHAFFYDPSKPDQHIRLSYSYAVPDEIDKALGIIAKLIREKAAKKVTNGN
ncbi:kynurenine/alpha-aminoadipate aminotransferase, mitochondrial-like [Athalia rosae]|uniref:kynurenine/alpha-aminoadipate aminotransferase, mitochondrial-like n=1 Tax=Athalia rosae TaxID=37344 RepID=UPI002033EA25|nr:kynurenine/alpha-aminoadipate aminotransferase, mitochondrial-like [Athalia rosae]XP_012267839.2 kynurenine/alpha-aminoadipate aminotransferase, mitochondrial-like [Athalia rosae]